MSACCFTRSANDPASAIGLGAFPSPKGDDSLEQANEREHYIPRALWEPGDGQPRYSRPPPFAEPCMRCGPCSLLEFLAAQPRNSTTVMALPPRSSDSKET